MKSSVIRYFINGLLYGLIMGIMGLLVVGGLYGLIKFVTS
jgi:hypothetical protein